MEVSRGAQRLNNVIDSWSRGLSYDGRTEDIANDLLKGALDLQESLVMLRKVQEASQHMARLKRRQNEKAERGRIDEKIIDRTHSNQFSEQSYPMGFQRPWPSADGSSSSCTEELKKVIKESLVRQNVFPRKTTEALDSASEFPSTNSSQSFGVQTDMLSDSSFSPTTSRKERGPSLVAKLMGLEEVPSRSFPAVMPRPLESQKIQNHKRPLFEIDLPKVRKNNPIAEKVNPRGQKTPREILETTHFTGLLKKSSVREPKFQVHHFNDLHHEHFDDLPPIVIMKPRCTPYREFVTIREPVPPEEFSHRKLKAKAVPSKTIKAREGSTNMGKEIAEHFSKRVAKEERTKRLKEVVELDAKEIKPIENEKASGGKVKLYSHARHKLQPQVSETVDKKAKVKTISRKLPEKEISKPKIVRKSQDQGEISSAKLRKPQSIDKNEIPCRKSTTLNTTSNPKNQKVNISKEQKKNQMKKQRPVAEPEVAKPIAEQLGEGEEEKIIDISCEDDCTDIRIITTIADDLTTEHEVNASANTIGEDCKQSQSCSGDAIPAEEAHDNTNCCETDHKPDKEGSELKYLLLTNQSFIGHAEELLNLDLDCPKILPKNETNEIANVKLYLDCANELTERKSLQVSQVVCPLFPTYAGNSRLHISQGKLVEEICSAIENLTSYGETSGKKLASSDSIYTMMKRDMECNGLINGIWNWGWRHGFSADEAEQVVNEVENLVFSELIEEDPEGQQGEKSTKNKIPQLSCWACQIGYEEPQERRMSNLSDWASSVTSAADIQFNTLTVEQYIYNLKRDSEEMDTTIKELTTLLNSYEVANNKRVAELEDIIRRKNTTISKLKKDLVVLEQKFNTLTVEQDIYNLKRDSEEMDTTIKELTTLLNSSEVANNKRVAELEDIIRRKNTTISKLKKDLVVLEQKVVQLSRLRRPSFSATWHGILFTVLFLALVALVMEILIHSSESERSTYVYRTHERRFSPS